MRREAEQREEPMQHNTSKALDALSIVQKDEEEREPMDSVGYEEYRLVLSHDLVIGDTRIKLNDPIVTKYIVLELFDFNLGKTLTYYDSKVEDNKFYFSKQFTFNFPVCLIT